MDNNVELVDNWPRATRVSFGDAQPTPDVLGIAEAVFRSCNTPVSLASLLLLEAGEWDQLARRQVNPSDYLDAPSGVYRFLRDSQAVNLLRKWESLPSSVNRREAALAKWLEAERLCRESNQRIRLALNSPILGDAKPLALLKRAAKWIARVLGPVPDALSLGFGPGTCTGLQDTYATVVDKTINVPHVTSECYPYFRLLGDGFLGARAKSGLPDHVVTPYDRFTTVAKTALTDRPITIGGFGNVSTQLAIGRHLKGRLAMVGLNTGIKQLRHRDLPNGKELHMRLALRGSCTGENATIDLSSASDTVCEEVVRLLLPPTWYALLDDLRYKQTEIPIPAAVRQWRKERGLDTPKARVVQLQKFSAMGNGFTFELETLLFAALCHAVGGVVGEDTFVFGDDMIIPVELFGDAVELLTWCGFVVNEKKSFSEGLFRESCGGDYFCGFNVRSVFITKDLSVPALFSLHNAFLSRGMASAADAVLLQIPAKLKVFGPYGVDGCLWCRRGYSVRFSDGMKLVKVLSEDRSTLPLRRWNIPKELHTFFHLIASVDERVGVPYRGSDVLGWRISYTSVS